MKPLLQLTATAVLVFYCTTLRAQVENNTAKRSYTDSLQQPVLQKTTLTVFAGAVFAPVLHYFGRTDNEKSNAVLPTVLLQFDSAHVYVSGTAVLLNNKIQSFDYAGTVAEAGYKFGKQKGLGGNVYVNKFFYNTTQLPQNALKAQTGLNLSYLDKIINITASGSAAFSDKTDFFASAGLNKNFRWRKNKQVFVVIPTVLVNAGTQNFTHAYYKGLETPGVDWSEDYVAARSKEFNTLSYEFSVPLVYAIKHFYFIVTPTYVVPDHVIGIPSHPELTQKAGNIFFANVTALFSFKK